MGALARYLQQEFARQAPPGWRARREVPLIEPGLGALLGYTPQADVLLERLDGTRRLWVEFEVSRADPVANHVKYATAHVFRPQPATDAFVAMVSPHVARGRRNLAAGAVLLLRRIGMEAHQRVLLPHLSSPTIKALNHTPAELLPARALDIPTEIERALAVAEPLGTVAGTRVHYAGDVLEVLLNARRWNEEVGTPAGAAAWGRRTIRYFVHDPSSGLFAPAKFCAYVPGAPQSGAAWPLMTVAAYTTIESSAPLFDGHKAWSHLTRRIGMETVSPDARPDLAARFAEWLAEQREQVALRPLTPTLILPPTWF